MSSDFSKGKATAMVGVLTHHGGRGFLQGRFTELWLVRTPTTADGEDTNHGVGIFTASISCASDTISVAHASSADLTYSISGVTDCISEATDCISGLKDCISGATDCISKETDSISGATDTISAKKVCSAGWSAWFAEHHIKTDYMSKWFASVSETFARMAEISSVLYGWLIISDLEV